MKEEGGGGLNEESINEKWFSLPIMPSVSHGKEQTERKKKRKERMTRKQLRKKRHTHSPTTTIPNEKVLQGGESFVKKERRGK